MGFGGGVVFCRGGVSPPATHALISMNGRRNASPTDNYYPFALREANVLNPKFEIRCLMNINSAEYGRGFDINCGNAFNVGAASCVIHTAKERNRADFNVHV